MSNKVKSYINSKYNFGEEYREIFGEELRAGSVYCPFHSNTDTKAARYFEDTNSVYCFSCQRKYSVFDLLMRFNRQKVEFITENIIVPEISMEDETKVTPKRFTPLPDEGVIALCDRIKLILQKEYEANTQKRASAGEYNSAVASV